MPKAPAKTKQEFEQASFTGECKWAKVFKPETAPFHGSEPEWTINMIIPTEKLAKQLSDIGQVNVKVDKSTGEKYFVIKQKAHKKDGTPNRPPKIYNADGTDFNHEAIGNGSRVKVEFSKTKWDISRFASLYLQSITVLDLVEFSGSGGGKVVDYSEELVA